MYTVEQSINGKYIAIDPVTLKQILHKLLNRIEVLENEVKTLNYEYYNVNKPTSTIVVKKAKPGEVITYY